MVDVDAVVVGSGPNGLAAAVTLARAGLNVRVFEQADYVGGASATRELTLPGFLHDVGSAVHPMALASPFFQEFGLADRVPMVLPDVSYAHPLAGGRAGLAYRDLERTVDGLGPDGRAWRRLFAPLIEHVDALTSFTGANLLRIPKSPLDALRFGLRTLEQGTPAWNLRFTGDVAPAMLAGVAAHSVGRMPGLATSGTGMTLATYGHAYGWPIPVGGSQSIVDALVADLVAHGGSVETGRRVTSLAELPSSRVTLLDVGPRSFLGMADLPTAYRSAVSRYRYGNGVAKLDLALSAPVPWANPGIRQTGTVHLGGTRADIARSEAEVSRGIHPAKPYVLLSQPTLFDPSRAPEGRHTVWAYTHVPKGSDRDMTEAIIDTIEASAPGFRDTILASSSSTAAGMQQTNPNLVGGDISGGAVTLTQLVKRPVVSPYPWDTPLDGVYLCSSSTSPGPSVSGLPGWYAARRALSQRFGITA